MTQEALKLALEAMEDRVSLMKWQKARDAVKEALAQHDSVQAKPEPEQEPVAWKLPDKNVVFWEDTKEVDEYHGFKPTIPLYTTPPQRTWVGLTDEEKDKLDAEYGDDTLAHLDAIEAKLKQKNGYAEEKNT
jgi:hypothetical protein